MEQQASTLAFESASRTAPFPHASVDALAEAPAGRDRSFRDALAPSDAAPRRDDAAIDRGAREIDHRVDQAENEHARSMMAAVGLCLVSGGILASYGQIPSALAAVAVICFAAGIVLQHFAHRRLRAALIERSVAKGLPAREARTEVDAVLGRRLG